MLRVRTRIAVASPLHWAGAHAQRLAARATAPANKETARGGTHAASAIVPQRTTTTGPSGGVWLFLADMHFDQKRLERLDATCQWIVAEVERLRPSHIFLLGDTLHTRNEVHVEASSAVATFLQQLLHTHYTDRPPPHVHLLVGNHDMHSKTSRAITSLDSFAVHEPAHASSLPSSSDSAAAVSSPLEPPAFISSVLSASSLSRLHMYREISFVEIDGQKVLLVPYHDGEDCRLIEEYVAQLATQHDLSQIVCLAHLPITGATISGIAMEPTSGFKYAHATVALSTLSHFKRVFLGHFHIHQLVGGKASKVLYVGAPMQFNYGDANDEKKGFVSYEPSEPNPRQPWRLHPNPHALHYFSRSLADWEAELSESLPSLAAPSLYAHKCAEIVLPADLDSIQHERRINQVKRLLKEKHLVEDIKTKQLKAPERKTEDAALTTADGSPVVGDAVDGALLAPPADGAAATNTLVSDIVNGDLRSLVQTFLAQDSSLTTEESRHSLGLVMNDLLDAAAREGTAAAPSARGSKLFRAQLHRLEVSNFLSISASTVFDFSALRPGIWYICGRNGAGKSLLLEALTWALFGKTLRGHEADRTTRTVAGLAQDEIVNDAVKEVNPSAEVRVSVSFANSYTITRTHRHGVSGSTVRIDTPTGPLEARSSKKLDEEAVVSLLGIDFDRFVSSVVLSSTTKNFISAKPEEKRRIVEELLGFTQFELLHEHCKNRRTSKASDKRQLELSLKVETDKQADWSASIDKLTASHSQLTADLEKLQTDLEALVALCREHDGKRGELKEAERLAESKREGQAKEVARLQLALDELRGNSDHAHALQLRQQKSAAEGALATAVKQQLQKLYAAQTACTVRLNSASKKADEQRVREMQKLQQQITTLSQIDQARAKLTLLKQKAELQAQQAQAPAWAQTVERVLAILVEWSTTTLPEALRTRMRAEVIEPLQGLLAASRPAGKSPPPEADFEVLELENELDMLTDGKDMTAELATLPTLLKQQKELAQQQASAPTPAALEESQKADPAYAELQQLKAQVAALEEPSNSTDEQIVECLAAVVRANTALVEFDATMQQQRTRESTLQSQRNDAQKTLNALIQAETNARVKLRAREADQKKADMARASKEQAVILTQKNLAKMNADLLLAKEKGPQLEAAVQKAKGQLDACNADLSALTYWADRVSDAQSKQAQGFRSFCIQRVLGLLNPLLDANLELFSADETGAVSHPLGCVLTPELALVAKPGATSMEKRSEGQRKRTHLALFLALFTLSQRRSSFLNQFLFLDEAFDSLDEDGQKAVNNWIQQFASGGLNGQPPATPSSANADASAPLVFVITHSPYTNPAVSNGCITAKMDASRRSIYSLHAPGLSKSARPFVLQLAATDQSQVDDAELQAPTPKMKTARKPRAKKVKTAPLVEAAEPNP